ncbi:hypothetical protein ACH4L5_34650 [Streptomyces sp. NPDC017405]|uniref:hypothetical protein n=1 Tax=unclassified Streptomyces TaxID=2593676 RepID=UPI0037970EAD
MISLVDSRTSWVLPVEEVCYGLPVALHLGSSCRCRRSGRPARRPERHLAEWTKARVWAKLHRLILDELGSRGELDMRP